MEALRFLPDRDSVEVTMKVRKEMQPRITTNSVATLGSVSLLGEAAVDITASSRGMPIPADGIVPSGKAAGSLTDVATQASAGIDELTGLLKDVRGGKGTVGKLLTDDAIARDVETLLASLNDVSEKVGNGQGTVGRLLNDPTAMKALEASLQNLQEVTGRITRGEGSLGILIKDDEFARTLTSLSGRLNEFSGKLNSSEGTVGQLVTNPELFDHFNSVAGRLDTVLAGLQKGEGTAGMALQDKQLYENMNAAVVELRATLQDTRKLLTAIQNDPKRYLNIKVSLF